MPTVHEEHRKRLQEVEMVLQYFAQPENLTAPDSEYIRAIAAEKALEHLHAVLDSE